ncbi:MAG TPA: Na+/H+ antiporter subunit E [Desulfosalsimonadaceae bacterium]|nr:Na+/H+ antiporter subunit E [Desulfosalsimonadaceae bacterium]
MGLTNPEKRSLSPEDPSDTKGTKEYGRSSRTPLSTRALTFLVCMITWVILSGRFDLFHLILGVIASLIVAAISADILFPSPRVEALPRVWVGFLKYLPWLLYEVFLANLHVLYLTFHPRMKELIDPQVITFQSKLKDDMALLIFANSITLTPGTITLYVSVLSKYTVHAIDKKSAAALPGDMEKRVEAIFK